MLTLVFDIVRFDQFLVFEEMINFQLQRKEEDRQRKSGRSKVCVGALYMVDQRAVKRSRAGNLVGFCAHARNFGKGKYYEKLNSFCRWVRIISRCVPVCHYYMYCACFLLKCFISCLYGVSLQCCFEELHC